MTAQDRARYAVAVVVEDDPDVRELAGAVLEESALRVVEAGSAEEALAYIKEHADEVALIFADVNLPCLMDGVDLARTARLRWPHIHVVLTSGDPSTSLALAPRDAVFMPKPWRAFDVLVEAERAIVEADAPMPPPSYAHGQSASH